LEPLDDVEQFCGFCRFQPNQWDITKENDAIAEGYVAIATDNWWWRGPAHQAPGKHGRDSKP